MRDIHINISIVKFLTIDNVEIYKKVNEHGYAKISGIIEETQESCLMEKVMREKYALISIKNESDEEKIIFAGIIDNVEIQNTGGVKVAKIVLVGATRQLDGMREICTYQDSSMKYEKILDGITGKYSDAVYLLNCGEGEIIKKLIVKYNETDWEFIKRLASHFNQPIVPNYAAAGIRYSFGLGVYGKEYLLDSVSYKTGNNKEEFFQKTDNGVDNVFAQDFMFYEVESRDYIELGEKVRFKGQLLYVYEFFSNIVGGELVNTYILRPDTGFRVAYANNTKIIGASLNATIIEVKQDTVKVCVNEDKKQDKKTAKWFPYSTVYSSPDGTGWYCMPEEGDKVRLYFPNEKEEDGYIISSINFGNTENNSNSSAPRSNPNNKSISNKFNKQIEFTPTSITLTNNNGMSIVIDDDKGICIVCDKKIDILSEGEFSLVSLNSKVNVEASELIEFRQGNSKIIMKDGVTIEGAKLNVQ